MIGSLINLVIDGYTHKINKGGNMNIMAKMTYEQKVERANFNLARRFSEVEDFELKMGTQGRVRNFIDSIPSKFHNKFAKLFSSEGGLRDAINCKCIDCSCFQKEEITSCETYQCPLWKFRPYQ